jgi:hypothetical protein
MGMLLLAAVIAAVVLPSVIRARTTPAANSWINNLKLIDSSKQQWALEQRKKSADIPTWEDLRSYLEYNGNCLFVPMTMSTSARGQFIVLQLRNRFF